MLRNIIFIFFSMAIMILAPSLGQCENWKEFFKDGDGTWQYDKDSIHYPEQKKIFGLMVQNKQIVNVWTRWIEKSGKIWESSMERIWCVERERYSSGVPQIFGPEYFGLPKNYVPRDLNVRESIVPGSLHESLLKKVCP